MRTSLFVDETANVINPPLIEILNKGMEAGFQCVCAMQTISDLEARLGSAAQARMALGNLNNLIALRECAPRFPCCRIIKSQRPTRFRRAARSPRPIAKP